MRTRQDILTEINAQADKQPALSELQSNTSRVAFWKAIKDIVAFAIATLEVAFERHLAEVSTLIKTTEPGTDDWYKDLALKYQYGDTIIVQNNLTIYPDADESKRIIRRVAINEQDKGGFKIKVAKQDASGQLQKLSDAETSAFAVYMNKVKMIGIPITVVSKAAGKLKITAMIEVDTLLYDAEGKRIDDGSEPIKAAINGYLQGFPFDESFYLSKLVDAVQAVEGVKDVDITASSLDGLPFDRKIDEVPSGYLEFDNNNSTIDYVFT